MTSSETPPIRCRRPPMTATCPLHLQPANLPGRPHHAVFRVVTLRHFPSLILEHPTDLLAFVGVDRCLQIGESRTEFPPARPKFALHCTEQFNLLVEISISHSPSRPASSAIRNRISPSRDCSSGSACGSARTVATSTGEFRGVGQVGVGAIVQPFHLAIRSHERRRK